MSDEIIPFILNGQMSLYLDFDILYVAQIYQCLLSTERQVNSRDSVMSLSLENCLFLVIKVHGFTL